MDLKYDTKLGRGAFADVWLATDNLERKVAVKFFNDTAPSQAETNAINHAKALWRVDSSAVVRVYSVERQQNPESGADDLAIIMEYVDGPNLSLHRERLSTRLALNVIRDLVRALEAIHAAGLVHGDLHDGNVLITSEGAKVVDILYTHSLKEVGTKTAVRTRADDLRALAVLLRQVVEKTGENGPALAEAFYRASTAAPTVREIGQLFEEVLSRPPQVAAPSAEAGRARQAFETHVAQMAETDFAALLASVNDEDDHHVLWVTKSGEARLSPIGDLTPAGFAEEHEAEMQFRWETFAAGNGYCGPDAAQDDQYVATKLAELNEDWAKGKTGYIDY